MSIDNLTIKEARELISLFGAQQNTLTQQTLNSMLGKKVIIRTYSAGTHFGTLVEKSGNEVILKDARRMWQWWSEKSISLSGVAKFGIKQEKSKIAPAVEYIWLEAIEIIPCSDTSIKSIEGAPDVEAQ